MILLLLLNFNCQKDDNVQQNELNGHKRINTITFEDFKKINSNTNLINGIERHADFNFVKSKSGLLNRNEEEEEFIILTDEILMITDSIYNHYTFKVLMQSEGYDFYNLTLKTDLQHNPVDTKFLKYTPTEAWFHNPEQPYDGIVELIDSNILNLDQLLLGRSSGVCVVSLEIVWTCDFGKNHAPGEGTSCSEWEWDLEITYGSCPETIDAGDSTSGGTTGNDGGGDTGGNTGNPGGDSTSTGSTKPKKPCDSQSTGLTDSNGCIPVNETTQHQKNCDQLDILSSNLKIKQSFQDLQSKAADALITREYGYKLTLDEDPEQLQLGDDLTHLKPEYGGQIYGMSHTHQDKLPSGDKVFPMFSVEDVFNLGMLAIRHSVHPKEFDLYVLTLTVKTDNGGTETFALKINNWLDFVSWMNEYGTLSKQDRKRYERNLRKKYEKTYNSGGGNIPENYLNPFFKFLQDNDIKGVDMYQANDPSLNSWKRLELKNGSIIEENC